jgi:hypothetical protein
VIKKLEVLANIAVISTSLVVCTVLVKRYLLTSTNQSTVAATAAPIQEGGTRSRLPPVAPGTRISLPGLTWSNSGRTLLLALSTSCHFCSESAPFYQKLQHEKRDDVRMIALLPQSLTESRAYLDKLGIKLDDVTQAPLSTVGVSGTPTLLLIDNQGAVLQSWVGKLSETAAEEVRRQVSK